MTFPLLQPVAQLAIERVLNSLPEGFLIALFGWVVLRFLPRQNSRTRFVAWFLVLLAVAAVSVLGGLIHVATASKLLLRHGAAISLPSDLAAIIFFAWIVTAFVMLSRLAAGLWHLYQLRQTCSPIDPAQLDPALRQILDELNSANSFAARPGTLATSDSIRVPAALGLWKPMIVLPAWVLNELSPADLSIILRHEAAHLRHWDDWTNLIQKMVRALFFFHPAVWWIENRLSVEREMSCDDVVVAETANPAGYASCLISLLERSLTQRGWSMAPAIVHRAREASQRLARILDGSRPVSTRVSKPALGLISVFAVLVLVMLPNTPRVIAFEQSAPGPVHADRDYSASIAAGLSASMVHRANLETSSSVMVVRSPLVAKSSAAAKTSAPKALKMPVQDVSPGRTTLQADDQPAKKSFGFGHGNDIQPTLAALEVADGNWAMVAEPMVATAAAADGNIQPMPMVVIVHATQYVGSSPGPANSGLHSVVWRVRVWHITVVPTWEHKVRAPLPHST